MLKNLNSYLIEKISASVFHVCLNAVSADFHPSMTINEQNP